ncbi:hypothetical protein K491DRAFT_30077 [Lophiostoma macrostomum CBS 122681]|uniref:Uncharacterized protein n=1 Tax=Lophiostoma macrostomum CBS 122681 TaxID=1314788 RepID=A0A6A6T0H7_9PLEO|nr:hypothetical protein K491DRAFT_30077 [Lophiostoma macrostomum CBS 122681]
MCGDRRQRRYHVDRLLAQYPTWLRMKQTRQMRPASFGRGLVFLISGSRIVLIPISHLAPSLEPWAVRSFLSPTSDLIARAAGNLTSSASLRSCHPTLLINLEDHASHLHTIARRCSAILLLSTLTISTQPNSIALRFPCLSDLYTLMRLHTP